MIKIYHNTDDFKLDQVYTINYNHNTQFSFIRMGFNRLENHSLHKEVIKVILFRSIEFRIIDTQDGYLQYVNNYDLIDSYEYVKNHESIINELYSKIKLKYDLNNNLDNKNKIKKIVKI